MQGHEVQCLHGDRAVKGILYDLNHIMSAILKCTRISIRFCVYVLIYFWKTPHVYIHMHMYACFCMCVFMFIYHIYIN